MPTKKELMEELEKYKEKARRTSENRGKGGRATWAKMTPEQKTERARLMAQKSAEARRKKKSA